jgi:glycosyltransferase involved in cell wall biosynthesis
VSVARVAVVIPTRGRAAWCEEAVDSALAQQGVDVEVVVSMDGEQPDLRARLEAKKDRRVVLVSHPAGGRSAARNRGVAATRSRLVALLDDDDRLLPRALSIRVAALERHPTAALVHGPAIPTDAEGRPRRSSRRAPAERCEDGWDVHLDGRSVVPSTALLRRELFERTGGFDEDVPTGEDWLFFLRAAAVGDFAWIPEPTVLYRRHPGQARADARAQEAALPLWTARVFDDPSTPERVRARRDRVIARHLLWIARNHRRGGDVPACRRCAREAVRLDPALLLRPRRLAQVVSLALASDGEARS